MVKMKLVKDLYLPLHYYYSNIHFFVFSCGGWTCITRDPCYLLGFHPLLLVEPRGPLSLPWLSAIYLNLTRSFALQTLLLMLHYVESSWAKSFKLDSTVWPTSLPNQPFLPPNSTFKVQQQLLQVLEASPTVLSI